MHVFAFFLTVSFIYLLSNSPFSVVAVKASSHVQSEESESESESGQEGEVKVVGGGSYDDREDSMDEMAEFYGALPDDGVALQLVAPTDDRRRFKVNPVALAVLESIDEPVAILAAVGPYHG